MLKSCWPDAIGAEVTFWAPRLAKYLTLSRSFEAMFITVLTNDSLLGLLKGEHLL